MSVVATPEPADNGQAEPPAKGRARGSRSTKKTRPTEQAAPRPTGQRKTTKTKAGLQPPRPALTCVRTNPARIDLSWPLPHAFA